LTLERLRELKLRISEHYLQEAEIMGDIIRYKLSDREMEELNDFMLNSKYAKLIDTIHELSVT